MVQDHADAMLIVQHDTEIADGNLADYITEGFKKLIEQNYSGPPIEFSHSLGKLPLIDAKPHKFLGVPWWPVWFINNTSYVRPFRNDFSYENGIMSVSDWQGYADENNRLRDPNLREIFLEDMDFNHFSQKEKMVLASQVEAALEYSQ